MFRPHVFGRVGTSCLTGSATPSHLFPPDHQTTFSVAKGCPSVPENTDIAADLSTRVMDVRAQPLSEHSDQQRDAMDANCDRVSEKSGAKLAAAFFQSAV
jgi:hypothetical protein